MIQIKDLQYKINGKIILEDIFLELAEGEFAAIIGPNGAGKSTLVKLILGLLELKEGSIFIDGVEHYNWLKNNTIGYLPQYEEFDNAFPATALDIVLMGLAGQLPLGTHFNKNHKQKAMEALEQTGVAHLAKELIGKLSGGEFQRVLLARALVSESKYLILDEPEASLDRPSVESFFALLKELNSKGKTIITISHDLTTLSKYCSFLVCLNRRLHCHNQMELIDADVIHKTFGDSLRIIEKDY
ncbi:MAG: ABC transporter ATP-binding protein [Candidatus Cloacimonadota bacterium]|jgi:zinc transport system ATP-binding protein|uniref:ABC transporter, ATP-binding protein n=1 Tax=Cloacimonas acidaminovorans (strain Evry) TaxID=459349 RepID=B0VIX9_CLOAI|nr:ABC transporter ATP-binding protein [Candidatus Cloacimonas acidaminovorans]MDI9572506.1 ABC transporter ATP-binding protein [Candidatus Cloacimonadota bacterium]NLM90800.1 ABC transporter ATP-binding protein [Candidatus Cloacimonadota bacterium]CAO80039.1 ABC transporter, ATP-binding protein [Candidatus Cloacimonas acidaminovorans str. Evry]HOI02164.1 ABC transporter ATP-binding protein [Candidatus Cloacimonas acidaminovorans]HQF34820.1 ABC transporter ATP-binding protein [Candidatus Cloac